MVLPDTRDIRAYEVLTDLMKKGYFEEAEKYYKKSGALNKACADEYLVLALVQLGIATHPAQDRDGHDDFFVNTDGMFPLDPERPGDGDNIEFIQEDPKTGIKTEQFSNMPKSRDATYNILGRFQKEYGAVINMR